MAKRYLASLLAELRLWGGRLGKKTVINSIFFGGGTPSLLPARAIKGILDEVRKTFTVLPGIEISAEANPDSALADDWLFAAKNAGINRLSLGVQSFHDPDLLRLGRVHDARIAEIAFATARSAGFNNISLDLMWGLPGDRGRSQRQQQWLKQLTRAMELRPDHISTYGLTLEQGSALEKDCRKGLYTLPGESELSSMYLAGADLLASGGYLQYEISNFARMGFECKHNSAYWHGEEYLGLGPAATSTMADRRWTNPPNLDGWIQAVKEQSIASNAEVIDEDTRIREMLMLRLRMSKGIAVKDYQDATGRSFTSDFAGLVQPLIKNGLATHRNGMFRLTRSGMLVSDTILAHFFEAFETAALRNKPPDSA